MLLANIDTRKEDFHVVGKDYQEAPEYIEDCPKDTTESVQIDTVLILPWLFFLCFSIIWNIILMINAILLSNIMIMRYLFTLLHVIHLICNPI